MSTVRPKPSRLTTVADRFFARFVGGLLTYLIFAGPIIALSSDAPVLDALGLCGLCLGMLALGYLMLARGQTPGYFVLGLAAVHEDTGIRAGGRLLLRLILQRLFNLIQFLEVLVCIRSFDQGQTWFDRVTGIVVVKVASKRQQQQHEDRPQELESAFMGRTP